MAMTARMFTSDPHSPCHSRDWSTTLAQDARTGVKELARIVATDKNSAIQLRVDAANAFV